MYKLCPMGASLCGLESRSLRDGRETEKQCSAVTVLAHRRLQLSCLTCNLEHAIYDGVRVKDNNLTLVVTQ